MTSVFEKRQWQHLHGIDMKLDFNIKIECSFVFSILIKLNSYVYCA